MCLRKRHNHKTFICVFQFNSILLILLWLLLLLLLLFIFIRKWLIHFHVAETKPASYEHCSLGLCMFVWNGIMPTETKSKISTATNNKKIREKKLKKRVVKQRRRRGRKNVRSHRQRELNYTRTPLRPYEFTFVLTQNERRMN